MSFWGVGVNPTLTQSCYTLYIEGIKNTGQWAKSHGTNAKSYVTTEKIVQCQSLWFYIFETNYSEKNFHLSRNFCTLSRDFLNLSRNFLPFLYQGKFEEFWQKFGEQGFLNGKSSRGISVILQGEQRLYSLPRIYNTKLNWAIV